MNGRIRAASERGVALLEIALVFPVIFLLFAATFESSRGLYARNQGELLSQEVAAAVFHECKDKALDDANPYTSEEARRCVQREVNALHRLFDNKNPRSVVIATLYRRNLASVETFTAPEKSCLFGPQEFSDFRCEQFSSRFENATEELRPLILWADWVVVVETFVKTDGTVERILAPLGMENTTYYSVTVL